MNKLLLPLQSLSRLTTTSAFDALRPNDIEPKTFGQATKMSQETPDSECFFEPCNCLLTMSSKSETRGER